MKFTRQSRCAMLIALLAGCFVCTLPLHAASVEVLSCQPATQKAHVTIALAGTASRDVKAVLSWQDGRQIQNLSMDRAGRIVLPRLQPGTYLVEASAPANQGGALCLEISPSKQERSTHFAISLHAMPPAPPTLDQLLTAAENQDPVLRLQQFKGVVTDPAKSVLSGATVEIRPKGVRGDFRTLTAPTDAEGHFSAHLPDGIYTAVFTAQGFGRQIIVFEIAKTGSSEELQVPLQIGFAAE